MVDCDACEEASNGIMIHEGNGGDDVERCGGGRYGVEGALLAACGKRSAAASTNMNKRNP